MYTCIVCIYHFLMWKPILCNFSAQPGIARRLHLAAACDYNDAPCQPLGASISAVDGLANSAGLLMIAQGMKMDKFSWQITTRQCFPWYYLVMLFYSANLDVSSFCRKF